MTVLRIVCLALVVLSVRPAAAQTLDPIVFGVTGADDGVRTALIDASLLVQGRRDKVSDPQEILAAARSDYARMIGVLYERGYFGPVISIRLDGREAAEISPLEVPARIDAIAISVTTGPIYRFSQAQVAPLAPDTAIPDGFRVGEIAETPVIARSGRIAVRSWRELGYAKADITEQNIVANHPQRAVAADLRVTPGPQLRFGTLTITGNTDVETRRIRQIAGLPTGEVFSPAAVQNASENVRRTGAFRSVVLREAEEPNADGTLNMDLIVAEGPPRRIGFGAEIASDDGIELSAFWIHRNWLGGAERLELNADVTSIASNVSDITVAFSARFTRPATPRPDTDQFILADIAFLDERDYSGESINVGIGYLRRFTDRLTGEAALGFNISQLTDAFGESDYALIGLPTRLTFEGRNDLLNPTKGVYLDGRATPFVAIKGTDNGARFFGDARTYLGLGSDDRVVLAGRAQLGSIVGPDLENTPNYFLFYSGGGGTVRGQEYQSLGVDLGNGLQTGGKAFLGFSGEVRATVSDAIQVVGFYDWGYIGAESFPDGSGESQAGAGLGIRYLTPIGPLRVDVGTPVSGDEAGSSLLLYIGIGQAF
jgi:translocation and assembly module TamA